MAVKNHCCLEEMKDDGGMKTLWWNESPNADLAGFWESLVHLNFWRQIYLPIHLFACSLFHHLAQSRNRFSTPRGYLYLILYPLIPKQKVTALSSLASNFFWAREVSKSLVIFGPLNQWSKAAIREQESGWVSSVCFIRYFYFLLIHT